jgi:hypothetical protein
MASQLLNVNRKLKWSDFNPPKNVADPGPNSVTETAQTKAHAEPSGIYADPVGKQYKLRDSVVVKIVFDPPTSDPNDTSDAGSWVASFVSQKPQAYQDSLLNHEQGHYNIAALLGKDLYNALMALKSKTYASASDLASDVNAARTNLANVTQPVIDRYDGDTKKGMDATQQAKWDGYFSTAFGGNATLVSVLAQNGITVP